MSAFTTSLGKELAVYFLDRRFLVVFGICAVLSALSVTLGAQDYLRRLDEANSANELSRKSFRELTLDQNAVWDLFRSGYWWSRQPQPLSPLVYGQTGTQPREAHMRYQERPQFETSHFATDPVHALYGVLDLHFIVTVVITLCTLLFTHDAVCGEKQDGTLRLTASFPVSRATIAGAKMLGSSLAVLTPFLFASLVSCAALSLTPEIQLVHQDWARIAGIIAAFTLCLAAFASAGVLISSLVERRITAFILLLGIWTTGVLFIPNIGQQVARAWVHIENHYGMEIKAMDLEKESEEGRRDEWRVWWDAQEVGDWSELSDERKQEINSKWGEIRDKWTSKLGRDRARSVEAARNLSAERNTVAQRVAMLSPVGAATVIAEDFAGTGPDGLMHAELSLAAYYDVLNTYVTEKSSQDSEERTLGDFPFFNGPRDEPVAAVLERNVAPFLSLILLTALGFAAAFVAIIRYDVR